MKTTKIILLCGLGLGLLCSIVYTGMLAVERTKTGLRAWERERCWTQLGSDLEGKEFELDTKKKQVKPLSTLTSEDMLKALYVYHWKHYQVQLRLEQIEDLARPIEEDE